MRSERWRPSLSKRIRSAGLLLRGARSVEQILSVECTVWPMPRNMVVLHAPSANRLEPGAGIRMPMTTSLGVADVTMSITCGACGSDVTPRWLRMGVERDGRQWCPREASP